MDESVLKLNTLKCSFLPFLMLWLIFSWTQNSRLVAPSSRILDSLSSQQWLGLGLCLKHIVSVFFVLLFKVLCDSYILKFTSGGRAVFHPHTARFSLDYFLKAILLCFLCSVLHLLPWFFYLLLLLCRIFLPSCSCFLENPINLSTTLNIWVS